MKYIFSILTIFVLTSGFTCSKNQPKLTSPVEETIPRKIKPEYEDKKNGVICYLAYNNSISCVKVR